MKNYTYPDDPKPADSVVATLCNLNRGYITKLEPTKGGKPVVDNTLSVAVLSLSDLLDNWDSLRPHYPDAGPDIDTAWTIRNSWDDALLAAENGDTSAAQSAMATARKSIKKLPASSPKACASSMQPK